MNFEVQHALTRLDSRTPTFFVTEIFDKADETAKRAAIDSLGRFEERGATKLLIQKLKLY